MRVRCRFMPGISKGFVRDVKPGLSFPPQTHLPSANPGGNYRSKQGLGSKSEKGVTAARRHEEVHAGEPTPAGPAGASSRGRTDASWAPGINNPCDHPTGATSSPGCPNVSQPGFTRFTHPPASHDTKSLLGLPTTTPSRAGERPLDTTSLLFSRGAGQAAQALPRQKTLAM
jgi:hypothetical protein